MHYVLCFIVGFLSLSISLGIFLSVLYLLGALTSRIFDKRWPEKIGDTIAVGAIAGVVIAFVGMLLYMCGGIGCGILLKAGVCKTCGAL